MLSLRELQTQFSFAMLAGRCERATEWILPDDVSVESRLDVYRNTIFVSLKDALKEIFPAICRVVDERFFLYAAYEFIKAHPPTQPCLSVYGEQFPRFLADFTPSRHLLYLPDLARVEWLLHRASVAPNITPLSLSSIASMAPEDLPSLVFQFAPSTEFLRSPWPVDRIWRTNRVGSDCEEVVDLGSGSVCLEVGRIGDEIGFHRLSPSAYCFRTALHAGSSLESAVDAALETDPGFDFNREIVALLGEGGVASVSVSPTATTEESR